MACCRPLARTTAHSFLTELGPSSMRASEIAIPGKELGKTISPRFPTVCPVCRTACRSCGRTACAPERSRPINLWRLHATNPARIFGLYPRKGALLPGSDADIVIWDPEKKVNYGVAHSHQRTDYNLYEGWELTGYPEKVFLRGKLIVDGDQWKGRRGDGKFLKREMGEVL